MSIFQYLAKLPMVGFQQFQHAQCFLVGSGLGGRSKLGSSEIVFFTGSDRIRSLCFLGCISGVGICLVNCQSRISEV